MNRAFLGQDIAVHHAGDIHYRLGNLILFGLAMCMPSPSHGHKSGCIKKLGWDHVLLRAEQTFGNTKAYSWNLDTGRGETGVVS